MVGKMGLDTRNTTKLFLLALAAAGLLLASCTGVDGTETAAHGSASETIPLTDLGADSGGITGDSEPSAALSPEDPKGDASAIQPEANEKPTTTSEDNIPATSQPPSECLTAGSNGPTDAVVASFTASNGVTSEYRLYPADGPGPSGLILYLHGDGAYSYNNPGSLANLRRVAAEQNMALLVPLVPNGAEKAWWKQPERHTVFVHDLMQSIVFDQYQVDKSRVVLSGFSGGTDFLSLYYIPSYWETLECGGGAVLLGGGGKPFQEISSGGFNDNIKANFRLHYYTGQDDNGVITDDCDSDYDALETSRAGAAYYTNQGFQVTSEHPDGINHCNVSDAAIVDQQIGKWFS